MLIRRLTKDDLEAVWALLQRLQQGGDDNFYFGAFDENLTLIGMIGFVREGGVKSRHKGDIVSLYTLPTARGHGIARALMQAVIDYAKQQGIEQLHLAVVTTARPARNLYRSLGFQTYGLAPRTLKLGERYWDEEFMLLELNN